MENSAVSLSEQIASENDATLIEMIDSNEEMIEDSVITKILFECLKEVIKRDLTVIEYFVLFFCFGIINEVNNSTEIKTLAQVVRIIGLPKERVRQIGKKAIQKIK